MMRKTIMPVRPLRWINGRVAVLLAAICVVGCLNAAEPADGGDTGIKGTVLWGPVKPGPEIVGQDDEAPLSATFTVQAAEQKVAYFRSDRNGHFEVSLPPGDYTIVPARLARGT